MLCESLVLSVFNYGDILYSPFLTQNLKYKIQKVQNSCLRLIYGVRRRDHISHLLPVTKWLDMKNRRLLHSACLYFKIILFKTPPYLYNKITFRSDVHVLNIRFKGTLTPPTHTHEYFKNCFTYQVTKVYNGLPRCLGACASVESFKRRYAQYLVQSWGGG